LFVLLSQQNLIATVMAGVIPVTDGFLHLDYKFTATLVLKNIEDS